MSATLFAAAPNSFAPTPGAGPGCGPLLRQSDVTRRVDLVGSGYRFEGPRLASSEPVLRGLFHTTCLRPGLILHRTRVCDLHDMRSSVRLEPGIKLGLVLEGESELTLGTQNYRLGPRIDGRGQRRNEAALIAFAEPDLFSRQWRRGRHESKVSITVQPAWLDHGGLGEGPELDRVRQFRERHLATAAWEPSARALALAHQIVHAPALAPPLLALYLESRTVELVAEALAVISQAPPAPAPALSTREHRRLRELCDFLDRGGADGMDLAAIAQHTGMSPAALQRAFRRFSGGTLFAYLRDRKLDAARAALENEGVNVSQAADIAGYGSAANFATAFKRRFGATPRALRARV